MDPIGPEFLGWKICTSGTSTFNRFSNLNIKQTKLIYGTPEPEIINLPWEPTWIKPSCWEVIIYHNSMDQNLHFFTGCCDPRVCMKIMKGLFPIGLMDWKHHPFHPCKTGNRGRVATRILRIRVLFWDGENVKPCVEWPPTFGNNKLTAWITWSIGFRKVFATVSAPSPILSRLTFPVVGLI